MQQQHQYKPQKGPEVAFPPIPSFSPELFAYLRCAPNQRKAFAKGIDALLGEGAVQVCVCVRARQGRGW